VNIRMIAVDMDGTLLDSTDQVRPATAAAVKRARQAGLPVVPVTGRPERLIWDPAAAAGLGPLGVGANGAVLVDLNTRQVLRRHSFSGEEAARIFDIVKAAVPGVLIAVDEGDRFSHEPGLFDQLQQAERGGSKRGRAEVEDIRAVAAGGCLKLVARHPDYSSLELAAVVAPLLQDDSPYASGSEDESQDEPTASTGEAQAAGMDHDAPGDLAEVTASDIAWIDIGPPGLSKATGLIELCERLDVHLDEVAAVGDHFNDLPMLRIVGLPVAMANAIPDVLAIADRVMPSNDEDGVAALIEEILSGR
jgi:hydroxymethylpyrimidine pyrophosphatase-like HAD family hydrolase